jgi:hypothetical protein
MISYPAKAARALAFLKRPYNDIDVFVEDTASPNMWVALLRRIVPATTRISSVNSLGSRTKVLDACAADQGDGDRPRLYIIDGDFDYLLGRRKPKLKFLYRIGGWSVESLLISESSLLRVCSFTMPQLSESDITNKLDFTLTTRRVTSSLSRLFAVFASAFHLAPAIATISRGVETLISEIGGRISVCPVKARHLAGVVAGEVIGAVGLKVFRGVYKRCIARAKRLDYRKAVCGKEFLFSIIYKMLRHEFGNRLSLAQTKVALAQAYDVKVDPGLRRAIMALAL